MSDNKKRDGRATGLMTARTAVDPRDREGARKSEQGHGGEGRSPRREESPAREEIARRAYEIYLARGRAEGWDVEDWLRAEAEVFARKASDRTGSSLNLNGR